MRSCVFLLMVAATSGCSLLRSRYAMDDPVYAEKYEDGAEKGDLLGKAKQALDARHTEDLIGFYLSGGAQVMPESGTTLGGAEVGVELYTFNWLTCRAALGGFAGTDEGYGGLDAGIRVQTPSRIAPFIGLGMFHGVSDGSTLADDDGLDNDEDHLIDEPCECEHDDEKWISAIYPEIGTHFWVNGRCRLTAYGRYLVTSEGRKFDDWLIGGQLTIFRR